jgi:hypothetical protein
MSTGVAVGSLVFIGRGAASGALDLLRESTVLDAATLLDSAANLRLSRGEPRYVVLLFIMDAGLSPCFIAMRVIWLLVVAMEDKFIRVFVDLLLLLSLSKWFPLRLPTVPFTFDESLTCDGTTDVFLYDTILGQFGARILTTTLEEADWEVDDDEGNGLDGADMLYHRRRTCPLCLRNN